MHLLHRFRCNWTEAGIPPHAWLGEYGELVAASWLRAHGVKILASRFRWGQHGEIDLVCRQGDDLIFCEVKSASSDYSGAPARRVTRHKRDMMRRAADNWLRQLGRKVPTRFDIVEVYLPPRKRPVVNWFPAAFPYHPVK